MSPIMHFSPKALNNHIRPLLYVKIKGYRTELVDPMLTIIIKKCCLHMVARAQFQTNEATREVVQLEDGVGTTV